MYFPSQALVSSSDFCTPRFSKYVQGWNPKLGQCNIDSIEKDKQHILNQLPCWCKYLISACLNSGTGLWFPDAIRSDVYNHSKAADPCCS